MQPEEEITTPQQREAEKQIKGTSLQEILQVIQECDPRGQHLTTEEEVTTLQQRQQREHKSARKEGHSQEEAIAREAASTTQCQEAESAVQLGEEKDKHQQVQ